MAPRVVLIEDDPVMGQSVMDWLAVEGYRASWFRTGADALDGLDRARPDAIICDIRLPDSTGEALQRQLAERGRGAPIIFVTGFGDIGQAVRLMRAGAADYVTKPFDIEELLGRIEGLIARRAGPVDGFTLGRAPEVVAVERVLRRIASIGSTVLVTGPSGSGKEVAARLLHSEGDRARRPFVAVNCAAIPSELLESELFGHERGAFTGATHRHEGLAERAGDGILFLDEVAELTTPLQAKLLRLTQERCFRRVGGDRDLPFRARLIAATNVDLPGRVRDGRFREDLLHRLGVIAVALPPLSRRVDDILPLARRFLAEYAAAFGRNPRGFSSLAEQDLTSHDYPGNIRELRNRIERAVALADGDVISSSDLFPERGATTAERALPPSLAEARDAAERRAITAALAATSGDVASAAERLGISRSTLFEKIRRLGVRGAE
jgi:DNA-binding NtrC family response regulator